MKLVRENLNEFERGDNSLKNLGIGKRVLIENWLKKYEIIRYVINDDLTINVNGDVDLDFHDIGEFPDYIQFNKVDGVFTCSECSLTSLRGCPLIVNSNFWCDGNLLTNLDDCPKIVLGKFICKSNSVKFTKDYIQSKCRVTIDRIVENLNEFERGDNALKNYLT
jgi:hypothetical protein